MQRIAECRRQSSRAKSARPGGLRPTCPPASSGAAEAQLPPGLADATTAVRTLYELRQTEDMVDLAIRAGLEAQRSAEQSIAELATAVADTARPAVLAVLNAIYNQDQITWSGLHARTTFDQDTDVAVARLRTERDELNAGLLAAAAAAAAEAIVARPELQARLAATQRDANAAWKQAEAALGDLTQRVSSDAAVTAGDTLSAIAEQARRSVEVNVAVAALAIGLLAAAALLAHLLVVRPLIRAARALVAVDAGGSVVGRRERLRELDEVAHSVDRVAGLYRELRLRAGELSAALARQIATGEILRAMVASPNDSGPVFSIILRNAAALCEVAGGSFYLLDNDRLCLVAHQNSSGSEQAREAMERTFPLVPHRGSAAGRSIIDRAVVHVPDILEDPEYTLGSLAQQVEFRSLLVVPMMRDGAPVGVIALHHNKPGRFADEHVEMLKIFADQAVIALGHARLFEELRLRARELSDTLARQTATAELLRAMVASPNDSDSVFKFILKDAVQLCEAAGGTLFVLGDGLLHLVAHHNYAGEALALMQGTYPLAPHRGTAAGRAVLDRTVISIPDVQDEPGYRHANLAKLIGLRSLLLVPMMRDGAPVGVIALHHTSPGKFPDAQVEMLKTFADLAVIALGHARLFEALATARDQAETANREKSRFLAVMSHELRTPMNAVIGFSHLMLRTPLSSAQRDHVGRILSGGRRLLGVINDTLDFSKIEAGQLQLDRVDFVLQDAFQEVIDVLSLEASAKDLSLRLDWDPTLPELVAGDPLRLGQVMMNLTANAIKFTERGGVTVGVHRKMPDDGPGHGIAVSITDTGIGMTEDQLGRLFQEFSQADSSVSRRYGGTGLGLVISKRLIEQMGGGIEVESVPGAGSAFRFTVRLAAADGTVPVERTDANRSEIRLAPPPWEGRSILVVEDNPTNQVLARSLLAEVGFTVEIASSGQSAIEWLSRHRCDLVLMDIEMPEMDGLETTRRILKLPSWKEPLGNSVPIIAMSAHATTEARVSSLAAGMIDHLTKPIEPDFLYAALARHLSPTPTAVAAEAVATAGGPPQAPQGFDTEAAMRLCKGDLDLYREMARLFVESFRDARTQLTVQLAEGTAQAALLLVH